MYNKTDLVELLSWRYNYNFGRRVSNSLHFDLLEPIELGKILYMSKATFYRSNEYKKLLRLSGTQSKS